MPADVRGETVGEHDVLAAVLARAEQFPDAPALWDGVGRALSLGQLVVRVRAVAGGLVQLGFVPGQALRVVVRPGIAAVTVALAAVLAGGTAVINLDGRDTPPLAPLPGAPADWLVAESMAFVGSSRPDANSRWIHVGAWLPGVPRTAISLRRLAAAPLLDVDGTLDNAPDPEQVAVAAVTVDGVVHHTRADLGAAVAWLGGAIGVVESGEVLTDHLALGLAALGSGARWRIASFAPRRRDAQRTGVIGVPATVFAEAAAALRGSEATLVVTDGPLTPTAVESAAFPVERLVVLSGRDGLLPIAVARGEQVQTYRGPGRLLGSVIPGVRVLVDGDRILTRGVRDGARTGIGPVVLDSGLRGHFVGRLLIGS